ncbi:MAG: hypothetical protein GW941_01255 [Candidatus Pacebacteria bacterium]|nr:hypothetical protein [Candidatus Paceibacterota bacterium]
MKETIKKKLEEIPPDIYIETASAVIIALLLTGVGEEYYDQGVTTAAYLGNIFFYGLMYPAIRRQEEGNEILSPLGIAEMAARSIIAAATPFLLAGAITNPEVIEKHLNMAVGIIDRIPELMDNVGKGLAENGPKVAITTGKVIGGIALAAGGLAGTVWTLKQAGKKLAKAYKVSSKVIKDGVDEAYKFANSYELQNPFRELQNPIKVNVEFKNPNIRKPVRRKKE